MPLCIRRRAGRLPYSVYEIVICPLSADGVGDLESAVKQPTNAIFGYVGSSHDVTQGDKCKFQRLVMEVSM